MFTANAKYGGDLAALKEEIHKKLIGQEGGDRKGVRQLAHGISNVFQHGQCLRDIDLSSITKVYPLLITRDEIGSAFYLARYLNEAFREALDRGKTRATLAPVFCMSVDHLEAFAGALSKVALSEILHARYRQDRKLEMPFWLPNNEALAHVQYGLLRPSMKLPAN